MEPTPELIEALRRDKIDAARSMTTAQKILAGAELFDYACAISKAGIRAQYPNASEFEVLEHLRRRIEIGMRREARP